MMMMASTTTTRSSPTGFGVIHHLNPPLPVPVVKDNNSNKTDKETTCKSSAKPSSRGHPQVKQKPSRLVTTSLITITSSSTTAEVSSSLPSSSSSSSSVSVSSPGDGPSVITTSSPMSQSPSSPSSPPSSFTSILSSAPIPSPGSTPLRILLDHWAEYVEQSTGRRFYHNYLTKESSWKPPRRTTSSLMSHGLPVNEDNDDDKEDDHGDQGNHALVFMSRTTRGARKFLVSDEEEDFEKLDNHLPKSNGHHQHHNQLQQKDSLITFKGRSFGNPLINGHTKNSNGSRSEEDLTSPSVASGIIEKMIPPPTSCRPHPKPRIGINVKPPVNRVASNSFVYPSPRKGWTRRVNPRSQVYFISRSSSLLNLSSSEAVTQSSFRLKPPTFETPVIPSADKKKIEKKDSKQEEPPLDKKKGSLESPSQSSSRVKSTSSSDSLTQSSSSSPVTRTPGSETEVLPPEKKNKIRERLLLFLRRRPALETLKKKGIFKDEPVFGCTLSHLCLREKTTIPKFVRQCIQAIESRDLTSDGIYRVCGNLSHVQKIRFQVNQDNYSGIDSEEDVHVLTGLLKMFFRDMKEPLLPCHLFDSLIKCVSIKDKNQKIKSVSKIIKDLPQANHDTLKFLLQHLLRVKELSQENRMHIQNLAIVFGPTLMWAESEKVMIPSSSSKKKDSDKVNSSSSKKKESSKASKESPSSFNRSHNNNVSKISDITPVKQGNNFAADMLMKMKSNQLIEFLLMEFNNIFKS